MIAATPIIVVASTDGQKTLIPNANRVVIKAIFEIIFLIYLFRPLPLQGESNSYLTRDRGASWPLNDEGILLVEASIGCIMGFEPILRASQARVLSANTISTI
jgi:hypothetical protein